MTKMKIKSKKRIFALVLPLVVLGIGTVVLGVSASLDPKISLPGSAVNRVEYYVNESSIPESLKTGLTDYLFNSEDMGQTEQYYVTSTRVEGEWAFISVSYNDTNADEALAYDELILTNESSKDTWSFTKIGTDDFDDLLTKAPEEFVTKEAKEFLYSNIDVEKVTVPDLRFPWDRGEEWQWWNRNGEPVWHDCRSINGTYACAIDMGLQHYGSGVDLRAITSADGTISNVCIGTDTVAVQITHRVGNALKTLGYYHIDKSTIDLTQFATGKSVVAGQLIGTLFSGDFDDDQCGNASQSNTSAHLHFMLPSSGVSVDDWSFNSGSTCATNSSNQTKCVGSYFSSTNQVGGCFPPASGTWTISGACTVANTLSVPGSIVVKSSGVLTVKSTGKLDMNLNAYKLSIENGGRIQIENNAKIY